MLSEYDYPPPLLLCLASIRFLLALLVAQRSRLYCFMSEPSSSL
jgi:hypothetical protein